MLPRDKTSKRRASASLLLGGVAILAGASRPAAALLELGYSDYYALWGREATLHFSTLLCIGFVLVAASWGVLLEQRLFRFSAFVLVAGVGALPEMLFPLVAATNPAGITWSTFWKLASMQQLAQAPGRVLAAAIFLGDPFCRWCHGLIDPPVSCSIVGMTKLVVGNTLAYCLAYRATITLFAKLLPSRGCR